MEPTGRQKGIPIRLIIAPDVPDVLHADSGRLRQVLLNLVGNAVKFTEAGLVFLNCVCLGPDRIRIDIEDTGIGISVTDQDRLFQPFTQVDTSQTRRFGGTGLGLMICKQLIELMGGTIGLRSEPGKGSTFWVELPV